MLVFLAGGMSESVTARVAKAVAQLGHTPTIDYRHADAVCPCDGVTLAWFKRYRPEVRLLVLPLASAVPAR